MKLVIPTLGVTILLFGCAQIPDQPANTAAVPQERISDRYVRKSVKSYELFDPGIDDHVLMLVQLTNGEKFPMLCRKTASGIYPIAQSVFAAPGAEQWSIMCEPRVGRSYALRRLQVSRLAGALSMAGRRLSACPKAPLLSPPSL